MTASIARSLGAAAAVSARGKVEDARWVEEVSAVELTDGKPGAQGRPLLRPPCWAAPILSHGLLYLRGNDRLVCVELIPDRKGK